MNKYLICAITILLRKAAIIFIVFQLSDGIAGSQPKDSFGRKNLFEWGATSVNLFNHNGFVITSPTVNYFFSYTRVLTKYHLLLKGDYHSYAAFNRHTMYKNLNKQKGDIEYTEYQLARFSIGKIWYLKKWRFSPYFSYDRRWGFGDNVFWEKVNGWEPIYAVSHYKSFGLGLGGSINFIIKKKLTFGLETHSDYFFQKNNLKINGVENPKAETDYQPNRKAMACHLKVGFLF